MIDAGMHLTVLSVFIWNLFCHTFVTFGLLEPYWIDKKDVQSINEDYMEVRKARGIGFGILYIISIPVLLMASPKIKFANKALLVLIGLCFVGLLGQTYGFYGAYQGEDKGFAIFKNPEKNWIEGFFAILLVLNIQPFVFSQKTQNSVLDQKRSLAGTISTIITRVLFFLAIGVFGYLSFGQKYMPEIFLFRKNYPEMNAIADFSYKSLLVCLLIFTVIGVVTFNQMIRSLIFQFFPGNRSKSVFYISSLAPFFVIFVLAFLKPSIAGWLNLMGLTVCLFNGQIVPSLMRVKIFYMDSKSNISFIVLSLKLISFILLGLAGIYFKIKYD